MRVRADVKCLLCGHVSGQIEGPLGGLLSESVFRAVSGDRAPQPARRAHLRCARCGGNVYLESWEQVAPIPEPGEALPAPRRGRPRTRPLQATG